MAGFVRRSGRDSNPRGFRLAVFCRRDRVSELPDEMTYGESYGPAMRVQTPEEARDYFYALVRRNMRVTGNDWAEAERVERINVGYWSGYYDSATAARVHALYGFGHPIFGTTRPTAEEAVAAGKAFAALSEATRDGSVAIEAFGRAVQSAAEVANRPE
jgi:hypothetical protein